MLCLFVLLICFIYLPVYIASIEVLNEQINDDNDEDYFSDSKPQAFYKLSKLSNIIVVNIAVNCK